MKTRLLLIVAAMMMACAPVFGQKARTTAKAKPRTTTTKTKTSSTSKVITNTTGLHAPTQGCNVTRPVAVDLGLPSGTKWADRNVGAEAPYAYGGLYRYGNKGKATGEGTPTVDIIGSRDDTARNKLGAKWCMPTAAQLEELLASCTRVKETIQGVVGFRLTGPNGNSIFLPLTGIMYSYGRSQANQFGLYQSGQVLHSDMYAVGQEVYVLQLWEQDDDTFSCCLGSDSKGSGNPIRAVLAE